MVPRHRRHQLGVKSPRRSLAVLLFVVSSIAGCASGPNYGEVKSATPSLAQDKARIVFFRQSRFAASVATLRLQIDGVTVGSLPNGSILSVDHATGNLNIRFERKGLLGFGHVDFPLLAEAGKEYYVELGGKPGCAPFLVGYVGCALAEADKTAMSADDHCGADGWCAAIRYKDVALPKLDALTVEEPVTR